LGPGQVLVDLVYHPTTTRLVEVARRRGASAVDGVGMLVHQAALAFTLWTGEDAPLAAMHDAVTDALQGGGAQAGPGGRPEDRAAGA
jgi:shikimate dehydrogenase